MKNLQQRNKSRRGNVLVEFSMVGIPIIFALVSVVSGSLAMWQYDNLTYGATTTARYISVHGASCTQSGNSCSITVDNVAHFFSNQTMALDPGNTILTLTDGSGAVTTCNPVSNCYGNSTVFPGTGGNAVGQDVTVKASIVVNNPIVMYWPPQSVKSGSFGLAATSRQSIVF